KGFRWVVGQRAEVLDGQQSALGQHGTTPKRYVVRQGHADGGKRDDTDDRHLASGPARPDAYVVTHVLAELTQAGRPELDLIGTLDGVSADRGRFHRSSARVEPEDRNGSTVDGQLGEREGRPAPDA